jgi:Ca-activated chloride channel family protein
MSKVIDLTSLCNRSSIPLLNQPQLVYILTELSPGKSTSKTRLPINFTMVLDHSGSMAGEKIRTMKEAVKNIIDQLNPSDVISIVTFETKTKVLIPAQPATDKAMLKKKVDQIQDAGGTNMATGLHEGINQASVYHKPDRTSRIILLTDGVATDKEDDSRKEADRAGELEIPIIGLGFGTDWNEDFIIDLANRSSPTLQGMQTGLVNYIPSPEQALNIFQEAFQAIQIVAQDVTVNIRMVQGLEARRVWQVVPMIKELGANVIQGRAIVIPVGELEKGGAAFLAEIMLPPRPEGLVRIAQTDITFSLPHEGLQRQAVDLIVKFTDDPNELNQLNDHVMNIVEKVQAFKLQTQALAEAEMGDVDGATRKLRQAVTLLLSQDEEDLAKQMQKEANRLQESGNFSSEGKKTIKLTSRKTIRLSD